MEVTYTVREVVQMVIDQLGNIPVPRKLNQQIGAPIDDAIIKLSKCIEAFDALDQHSVEPNQYTEQPSDE